MSRRTATKKRLPVQDPLFNLYAVSLLTNKVLKKGKKTVALKIIRDAFDYIYAKTNRNPLKVFELAIKNIRPRVEVKSRRIGGSTYPVPREVKAFRSTNLALRWLVEAANNKSGRKMSLKLANEIIEASNQTGAAVRKKTEMHKMAKANKAFAHFRY